MQGMVLTSPPFLPPDGSTCEESQRADDSLPPCQKEEAPVVISASAPSGGQTRRSVQFASTAGRLSRRNFRCPNFLFSLLEVLKQNPEGHWNRLAVPVGEMSDLSPIQPLGRRRVFDSFRESLNIDENPLETCRFSRMRQSTNFSLSINMLSYFSLCYGQGLSGFSAKVSPGEDISLLLTYCNRQVHIKERGWVAFQGMILHL